MPDTTRTDREQSRDPLAHELVRIAQTGLRPRELAGRRGRLPAAAHLIRTGGPESVDGEWAEALVPLIEQAVRALRGSNSEAMAQALFGLHARQRDLPYEQRRGNAVALWDPELRKQDASFTRRVLPRLTGEVARQLRLIDATPDEAPPQGIPLGTAPLADQGRQGGLERISFRAETWLSGQGQRPYQSDWVYRDRATADGVEYILIERKASIAMELEPITESIRSLDFTGTDGYGFNIWKGWLREPLGVDDQVEWGTRTRYDPSALNEVNEAEWIAQTVSHLPDKGPIERGSFVVHFDTRWLPTRVVKFVTQKGTLPDLVGPVTEDVKVDRHGVARADFVNLESWKTYGIYWWPLRADTP